MCPTRLPRVRWPVIVWIIAYSIERIISEIYDCILGLWHWSIQPCQPAQWSPRPWTHTYITINIPLLAISLTYLWIFGTAAYCRSCDAFCNFFPGVLSSWLCYIRWKLITWLLPSCDNSHASVFQAVWKCIFLLIWDLFSGHKADSFLQFSEQKNKK